MPPDQNIYKVPLEGLEAKSPPFDTADFAGKPRKINGFGLNVIDQDRLVRPRMWANGVQNRDELTVDSGCSCLYLEP
jgi:hypothetical protein